MNRRGRRRDERGVSTVELVLYMPLLMIAILITVQFALLYLGIQAASASAREAARVARVTDDPQLGETKGRSYAANLGKGVLEGVDVTVVRVDGGNQVRATVTGRAPKLLPFLNLNDVTSESQGPIERFVEDAP